MTWGTSLKTAAAAGCLLCLCGCLAQRGIDFGHWAQAGEKVPVLRVAVAEDSRPLTGKNSLLVLPPTGCMTPALLHDLHRNLCQELRNYVPSEVLAAAPGGPLSEYLTEDNIVLVADMPDAHEAARLGRLMGVTHVLCTRVREFRPYPPQVLDLCLVVVATASSETVAEFDAGFNAADQQVVMALGQYLQRRRARKYDSQNLDIMLRSPSEYRAFVSAECGRAVGQALWRNPELKLKEPMLPDDKERDE